MSDHTYNFMAYLKYYKPRVHDSFVSMVYMGVNPAKEMVEKIFEQYAKINHFPWKQSDINVFQIRKALVEGEWSSATWDLLISQAFVKPSKKFSKTYSLRSDN